MQKNPSGSIGYFTASFIKQNFRTVNQLWHFYGRSWNNFNFVRITLEKCVFLEERSWFKLKILSLVQERVKFARLISTFGEVKGEIMEGRYFGSPTLWIGLIHKRNVLIIYKIFTPCKGYNLSRFHTTDAANVTFH